MIIADKLSAILWFTDRFAILSAAAIHIRVFSWILVADWLQPKIRQNQHPGWSEDILILKHLIYTYFQYQFYWLVFIKTKSHLSNVSNSVVVRLLFRWWFYLKNEWLLIRIIFVCIYKIILRQLAQHKLYCYDKITCLVLRDKNGRQRFETVFFLLLFRV